MHHRDVLTRLITLLVVSVGIPAVLKMHPR
jgi:hypothetical protein